MEKLQIWLFHSVYPRRRGGITNSNFMRSQSEIDSHCAFCNEELLGNESYWCDICADETFQSITKNLQKGNKMLPEDNWDLISEIHVVKDENFSFYRGAALVDYYEGNCID